MGYRVPNQALEAPINLIIDGIEVFDQAVKARIESGEWTTSHIRELNELRKELFGLRVTLEQLHKSIW